MLALLVTVSGLLIPRPLPATAGLRAAAPVAVVSAAAPAASETASASGTLGAWLPVGSVSALTGLSPTRVEICGADYAVWEHEGQWSVLADACPHRLAPLSQGRVDKSSGCIECPYHGWQFGADGALESLPQAAANAPVLKDPKKRCGLGATSLPVHRCGDLLWAFFGSEVHGEQFTIDALPETLYPDLAQLAEGGMEFYTRELPYSVDILLENFMDPAHIPFAHHSLQGVRSDGSPIPMSVVANNHTHVEVGYNDTIRGKSREGVVSFQRPCFYHFRTRKGEEMKKNLQIFTVPVRAGRCRVLFGSPLGSKLPTWLSHAASSRFLNTDVWLHDAERLLRASDGAASRQDLNAYLTPTTSDAGTLAFRNWWRNSGMAAAPPHSFGPALSSQLQRLSRAEQISQWHSHSQSCAPCRAALKKAQRVQRYGLIAAAAAAALMPSGGARALFARGAVVALGLAASAAASKVSRIIQGEHAEPSRVAERSVAAMAEEKKKDK